MQLTDDADQTRAAGDTRGADALLQQALDHYQKALELRPNYSEAHNNLGHLYIRLGSLSKAGYHFARALQIHPDNHAARANLALAQYRIGAMRDAAENFHRVLEVWPNFVPALLNLARIRAADPDPQMRNGSQAIVLAEKACRLTPPADPLHVDALDVLAMAYAETGQFEAAIQTGDQAAALARQIGQPALAEHISGHAATYRKHQPVRITPPSPPLATSSTTATSTKTVSIGE